MLWTILIVILGIPLVLVFALVGMYNGLVRKRNRCENAFAQIDVQLKRRYDLIPNLVEVAKKVMKHERETLEAVISARNSASNALKEVSNSDLGNDANIGSDVSAMTALANAESTLSGTLGRLFALSESYPDLKANQNMAQLSEEITTTENKLGFARQAYNDAVMLYNEARETFPTNILANMFNFKKFEYFEVKSEEEREAVKVSFD